MGGGRMWKWGDGRGLGEAGGREKGEEEIVIDQIKIEEKATAHVLASSHYFLVFATISFSPFSLCFAFWLLVVERRRVEKEREREGGRRSQVGQETETTEGKQSVICFLSFLFVFAPVAVSSYSSSSFFS
jgi:hypothetical protein